MKSDCIMKENGEIEEDEIQWLPYLQAVVKETLRLHPEADIFMPDRFLDRKIEFN